MPPDVTAIRSLLSKVVEAEVDRTSLGVVVRVPSEAAPKTLVALKASELDFALLVDMLGADTGEDVEITYHLRSFMRDEDVFVKCSLSYGGTLRSVWGTFASALLPERETAELFGLTLAGHPNPKRLLTAEGQEPLLLKSVPIRTRKEVRDR